jgi:hypothetical protein
MPLRPPLTRDEDVTVLRNLRAEEQAGEIYETLCEQEEARQRAEWEAEFDSPFKPDGAEIHRVVMRQMAAMSE